MSAAKKVYDCVYKCVKCGTVKHVPHKKTMKHCGKSMSMICTVLSDEFKEDLHEMEND